MITPILSHTEAQAYQTFLALMWALTHPGRSQTWTETQASTHDGFLAIGQALLDLETSFYTPDTVLADELAHTTARPLAADSARYHFYPSLTEANLNDMTQASPGTMLYPDLAATIVIGCTFGHGETHRLTGPGIETETIVRLDGLPHQFWQLRQQSQNYPLGWDILLVDGTQVMGLPRTTVVSNQ